MELRERIKFPLKPPQLDMKALGFYLFLWFRERFGINEQVPKTHRLQKESGLRGARIKKLLVHLRDIGWIKEFEVQGERIDTLYFNPDEQMDEAQHIIRLIKDRKLKVVDLAFIWFLREICVQAYSGAGGEEIGFSTRLSWTDIEHFTGLKHTSSRPIIRRLSLHGIIMYARGTVRNRKKAEFVLFRKYR